MKLSIVVAVYNTSKYLKQCLESIFAQTMSEEDYEVIIVNDCSTDNSMDIINEIVSDHSNVIIVDKKVNEATFWSRVDGIKEAQGDWVGFVDSDDWCSPDMYETMIRKGEAAGADIVECGTIYEYEDGRSKIGDNRSDILKTNVEMLKYYSENPVQVALYIRIFSKRIMQEFMSEMYPYFDAKREKYRGVRNEDDLLWPLLLSLGPKVLNIEEHFCHHRMEIAGSTMDIIRKNPKKVIDACQFRIDAGFDVMHHTKDNDVIYPIIEHKQINVIFGLLGRLLETDFYDSKEKKQMVSQAIKRFSKESGNLSIKDRLRFLHLKIKNIYAFK